jgi:hypothetical protein
MNRTPAPRRLGLTATLATLVALVAPAGASALTDRWVDSDTGSNAGGNTCTVEASPCKTITQASNASQSVGVPGTIHVDQGSYSESVNIAQSNHLLADDFVPGDGGDETTISGDNTNGAVAFIQANASMSGFTIASSISVSSVLVADNGSIDHNTIYADANNAAGVEVFASSGHPTVTANTILANNGDEGRGIQVGQNVAATTIADNQIGSPSQGFDTGIEVGMDSHAEITGNTIQGLNQRSGLNARGIGIKGADAVTVSRNRINSAHVGTGEEADGIYVDSVGADGSVALDHNEIIGLPGTGVVWSDVAGTATMDGDVIARTSDRGFYAGNVDDLSIENATIVDTAPMTVNTATVKIDSSILDDPIQSSQATCSITYSRGPSIVQGGDGCGEFQTTLDPKFVDRFGATPDLHLAADSPLIDAGNPAAPAAGAVDIDGDARALEGDGACPHDGARDIGADEVVATVADCPVVTPPAEDREAPQTGIAGKRKQRGHVAHFTLSSNEAGSTFECRLDRGKFVPCEADYTSRRLNLGRHTLFVRATDAAGNTDPSVEAMKFKLKRPRV